MDLKVQIRVDRNSTRNVDVRMSGPHGGSIPAIKYFGTSWYERGWPYRRRRFWLTAFMSFLVAVAAATVGLLFSAIFDQAASLPARVCVVAGCAIPVVWSPDLGHFRWFSGAEAC